VIYKHSYKVRHCFVIKKLKLVFSLKNFSIIVGKRNDDDDDDDDDEGDEDEDDDDDDDDEDDSDNEDDDDDDDDDDSEDESPENGKNKRKAIDNGKSKQPDSKKLKEEIPKLVPQVSLALQSWTFSFLKFNF
jgi:hypothetical protein